MNLAQLPITLYPTRRKLIFWIITSIGIMIYGFWKLQQGRETETQKQILIGSALVAFGVIAIPIFALRFHPKMAFLHIDENGLTFRDNFRTRTVPWADIKEFGSFRVHHNDFVGWNYTPNARRPTRRFNKFAVGFEDHLPDTYGFHADSLADLLTNLHARHYSPSPIQNP